MKQQKKELLTAPINRSTDSVQIGGNDSNNSITTEELMVGYLGNSVTDGLSANAKSSIMIANIIKYFVF